MLLRAHSITPTLTAGVLLASVSLGHVARAQDTPVRVLSQSSPGFIPSYPLESEKLRREMLDTPSIITDAPLPLIPEDGPPAPWWEATEAMALETMRPQRFKLGVSLMAGWEHDDNPYLSSRNEEDGSTSMTSRGGSSSYYARMPLSLSYGGGHVSMDVSYVPEFRSYDQEQMKDGFNQAASLSASYSGAKLGVGMDVSFASTDGGNIEVGNRVESVSVVGGLSATYTVSPKTTLGTSFSFGSNSYDEFNSNVNYGAQGSVDYALTPKTQVGMSGGYSKSEVDIGSSSDALSASMRINWQTTSKISIRVVAGCEWRQNEDIEEVRPAIIPGGSSTTVTVPGVRQTTPVFSFGTLYEAGPNTSITLDGYRRFSPSISELNQNFYSTGVVIAVNQRIRDRISCSLSLGYENSEYEGAVEGVVANRSDDYWYMRSQVSYTIGTRLSLSLYYQYSQNESSEVNGASFDANLIGASVSYGF